MYYDRDYSKEVFKDPIGNWRTLTLFFETSRPSTKANFTPPFTLKDADHTDKDGVVYKSLRKIYIESEDPTEYSFAMKVFNSWDCWVAIKKNALIMQTINKWRDELEVRLRSKGVTTLIEDAASDKSRSKISSSKYLSEKGWMDEDKRGRPSKKKIQEEALKISRVKEEVDADIIRMGIV